MTAWVPKEWDRVLGKCARKERNKTCAEESHKAGEGWEREA